jgi:hypothetical protein
MCPERVPPTSIAACIPKEGIRRNSENHYLCR